MWSWICWSSTKGRARDLRLLSGRRHRRPWFTTLVWAPIGWEQTSSFFLKHWVRPRAARAEFWLSVSKWISMRFLYHFASWLARKLAHASKAQEGLDLNTTQMIQLDVWLRKLARPISQGSNGSEFGHSGRRATFEIWDACPWGAGAEHCTGKNAL